MLIGDKNTNTNAKTWHEQYTTDYSGLQYMYTFIISGHL